MITEKTLNRIINIIKFGVVTGLAFGAYTCWNADNEHMKKEAEKIYVEQNFEYNGNRYDILLDTRPMKGDMRIGKAGTLEHADHKLLTGFIRSPWIDCLDNDFDGNIDAIIYRIGNLALTKKDSAAQGYKYIVSTLGISEKASLEDLEKKVLEKNGFKLTKHEKSAYEQVQQ